MALSLLVLDTNAVINIVGKKTIEPPPDGPYAISMISEIEILGYYLLDAQSEQNLRMFLQQVEIVPLTGAIKQGAIRLRRAHRLKTPDAIIAATALDLGSSLVSNDTELDRVDGLRRIPLTLKS
jgi:predicted nucleic acid-binding protein